jgi:propionyl-CoA carboxylase beta chain
MVMESHPEQGKQALAELRDRLRAKQEQEALAAARQHGRGKNSARERIGLLLDPGSFVEVGGLVRHRSAVPSLAQSRPVGDAVVTGHGTVRGHPVCVFAHDFTVFGGSLGEVVGEKILKIMDLAMQSGIPIVGINDSAGGRIQEGVVAQGFYGEIFTRNVRMSGMVPQISLIMGPCAGGAAYSPALTDFVIMVGGSSQMFATGPAVLRNALGEDVGLEELGGAWTHNIRSGAAHHLAATEEAAIGYVRELLSYLQPTTGSGPPKDQEPPSGVALNAVIPGSEEPYDIRTVLYRMLDGGVLLEVHRWFAPNIVVGFARIDGRNVGVVANQPARSRGQLDADACQKAARFVRTCDAFHIPVVTLVDVTDSGADELWAASRGAALLHAYAEATVPKLTVIVRHAERFGYVAMGSRHLGADLCVAWPTARIDGQEPYPSAERGYLDDVIEPADTRMWLSRALRLLATKKADLPPRKHENIPL